jgi:hypothetical protein
LVLISGTFSATGPIEGVYLMQNIVRSLRMLCTRAVFATRVNERGEVEILNNDSTGDIEVANLAAGSVTDQVEPGTVESTAR